MELLPPAVFARQILLRKNKIPEEKRVKAETAIDYRILHTIPALAASFLILSSENPRGLAFTFIVL